VKLSEFCAQVSAHIKLTDSLILCEVNMVLNLNCIRHILNEDGSIIRKRCIWFSTVYESCFCHNGLHFNLLHTGTPVRRLCDFHMHSIEWFLPDLHIRQSDICQTLYWYNWFSCWWARGCSKHTENWNKHIRIKNCASSCSFTRPSCCVAWFI
jgi:hypothetical protein